MCVLITVGTTRFDALISVANDERFGESLSRLGYTSLFIQYGNGCVIPRKASKYISINSCRFIDDFAAALDSVQLVISHAGAGTCLESLTPALQRRLIIVVNDSLMDNHQLELAVALSSRQAALATYPCALLDLLEKGNLPKEFQPHFPELTNFTGLQALIGARPCRSVKPGFKPFNRGHPEKLINYLNDIFQ